MALKSRFQRAPVSINIGPRLEDNWFLRVFFHYTMLWRSARVAELVDARDLAS